MLYRRATEFRKFTNDAFSPGDDPGLAPSGSGTLEMQGVPGQQRVPFATYVGDGMTRPGAGNIGKKAKSGVVASDPIGLYAPNAGAELIDGG
jgi:hypothetical protein